MKKEVGKVVALFISKKSKSERTSKAIIELELEGVIDDKFYGKDRERSVLLTTTESYDMALEKDIEMDYGTLGENILIDYNPYTLKMGEQLQIGEILLEVTRHCTICNHLSVIDKTLPKLLKDDRGIFVKVVKRGKIKIDDKVYLL